MSEQPDHAAQPTLRTERLVLRPFASTDAPEVQRMAGDREVASRIPVIPHPYEDGMAEAWIATHANGWRTRKPVTFAITRAADGVLTGAITIGAYGGDLVQAELGYWLGREHWGHGYATEAARTVVSFGWNDLGLVRIFASHMGGNDASANVLKKVGMTYEGCRPRHVLRFGRRYDDVLYGMFAPDVTGPA